MKAAVFNAVAATVVSVLYLAAWLCHGGGMNLALSVIWLGVAGLWFSTAHYRLKEQKARNAVAEILGGSEDSR
ncbi:hypothetical protein [Mycobacterium avium]|uniref:hypothetical protein n=1 Tax=Mycobacterium avium TaxID=1764 RepID=UPI00115B5460|nr:hypothetical protein [Mycobacterium avium]